MSAPLSLSSKLELHHTMRDMMTLLSSEYRVSVELHVDAAGRAELHLQGSLKSHITELSTPNVKERPTSAPWTLPIDARWTGTARREKGHLILHFESSTDYKPALAVDVEWECVPQSVQLGPTNVAAWRCATAQSQSQRQGAGHWLPPYMQVPLFLAAPAERLQVTAQASGGADHRSTLSPPNYSRY